MIAVCINGARIGSLLKFPHLKLPWCAYAHGGISQSFKTRKAAVSWIEAQAPAVPSHQSNTLTGE